jgi:hypothetical protein
MNKHHLHRPNANLSYFQNSTYYVGIKTVNSLPPSVTILKNYAKFKAALRNYLHTHLFYSVDELFMCKDDIKSCEIKSRNAMAKAAFNKKRALFTSEMDLELRKKLVKCYIWSIALYDAETWMLRAVDQKHLESSEMRC